MTLNRVAALSSSERGPEVLRLMEINKHRLQTWEMAEQILYLYYYLAQFFKERIEEHKRSRQQVQQETEALCFNELIRLKYDALCALNEINFYEYEL
jgi:hypothetical protein